MKALVLVNDSAGTVAALGAEAMRETMTESCATAGWSADFEIGGAVDLMKIAKTAKGYDVIVSSGGDGTHAAIASALLDRDTHFLPLPCGTVNEFCRDLGLPMDVQEALKAGLNATPRRVDAGLVEVEEIGPRVFLNNIVFGAYADLAEAREDMRDVETFDDASFALVEASSAILNANAMDYLINLDGAERGFSTNTLIVSNNPFTEAVDLIPRRARIDTGALAVYLVAAQGPLAFTRRLLEFLTNAGVESEWSTHYACERCSISAKDGETHLAIDGDPIETKAPVVMSIAAGALSVLAPADV